MGTTQENLMAAFAGESQANRKYLAFAEKAEAEGRPGLARLFRAAADGETVHALRHLATARRVNSSLENVRGAIEGETYEIEEMYPQFVEQAKADGNSQAQLGLEHALKVEMIHQQLFRAAESFPDSGGDIEFKEYFVCGVCGCPVADEAPGRCPVCGAPREKFRQVV